MKVAVSAQDFCAAMALLQAHNYLVVGQTHSTCGLITLCGNTDGHTKEVEAIELLQTNTIRIITDCNIALVRHVSYLTRGIITTDMYYCLACSPTCGSTLINSPSIPELLSENYLICGICERVLAVRPLEINQEVSLHA